MRKKLVVSLLAPINGISALTKLFSAGRMQKITSNLLILAAVTVAFGLNEAKAGLPGLPGLPAPPGVNVHVNGFLPAPPGVHVQIDSGRPYYVEQNRRVYMERERPAKYYKKKHYKKHHRDDDDHDRGHDRGRRHDH